MFVALVLYPYRVKISLSFKNVLSTGINIIVTTNLRNYAFCYDPCMNIKFILNISSLCLK